MNHDRCKQQPRSMPAPVMAVIRVRREPKMGDLERKTIVLLISGKCAEMPVDNTGDEMWRRARHQRALQSHVLGITKSKHAIRGGVKL